jgi:hypothetical protein
MSLLDDVGRLTMQVARPLLWHDLKEPWPKRLTGGSCFALRFDAGIIGITADHVVNAYEQAQRQMREPICLLRTVRLNLMEALIDRDAQLDLATFRLTEAELSESGALVIDCREEWPPPIPDRGREISFGGYPEELKKVYAADRVEFRFAVHLAHIQDVTDRTIVATYDPARDTRVRAAPEMPNLGANWSGCSGGPVLMHVERAGRHRFFAIGAIVDGPGKSAEGALGDFDRFLFRRVHCVNLDGTLKNADVGWLPGPP